jgi:UDP-glucose 4-epimerase
VGDISRFTRWTDALDGIDTVIHLAARVHMMHDASADPLAEFRKVNAEGTLNLARQAADAGVRRFIFLSSVKVNGERGFFRESDVENPQDAYAVSKYEAEQGLRRIAAETGMAVTIIRPPLVYGPGVKANFQALVRAVRRGIPLPLASIDNRRSLVAIDNLVDLIVTCIDSPAAANETFLVSDGEDLSTPQLVRRIAAALDRPPRLVPMPPVVLAAVARVLGRGEAADRLISSLQVDIAKARELLGWRPPFTVDEGLARAVHP